MRILIVLFTAVALAAGAASIGSAASRTCHSIATPTGSSGPVTASGVTCTTARSVAHKVANTGKPTTGWKCDAKAYDGGATISCHRGSGASAKRVRFQIAD